MSIWLFVLLMGGLLIAAILILFWHPQRSRTKTNIPTDRWRTNVVFRDDDRYWAGGVFYNNPDDPALFVPKRFGLGWTMNFGHPQARLVLIGMLLLPLAMAVLSVLASGMAPIGCHPSGCYPVP